LRGHRLAWSRIPTQLRYRPGALAVVGSNPTGPKPNLSLYLVPVCIYMMIDAKFSG
jgi:hypothetical protein